MAYSAFDLTAYSHSATADFSLGWKTKKPPWVKSTWSDLAEANVGRP